MDVYEYPPIEEPATPEFVLEVLQDNYRHRIGRLKATEFPTFETTVREWKRSIGQYDETEFANELNAFWGLSLPDDRWMVALAYSDTPLREVCGLISRHATRPRVRPATLFDQPCLPAGVFLTVRSYLAVAGADAREVAPSTSLAEYTRRYPEVFFGPISRLAPGALPRAQVESPPAWSAGVILALMGAGLFLLGCLAVSAGAICLAGILLAIGLPMVLLSASCPPASVTFGELRSFRDLSVAVAQRLSVESA